MFDLTRVTMESKDNIHPNYMLSPNMLCINSIHLIGSNYAQWLKLLRSEEKIFTFLLMIFPSVDPKYDDWGVEDA